MASLIETSEKGLPSRIMLYTFRSIPKWKPMGDDSISLEESFKPLAHRVFEPLSFLQESSCIVSLQPFSMGLSESYVF
ncbi:hypothetical protein NXV57_05500 [Bacteroides thetaiotaomicron]|nr:hypothetical protein [Bacteroides thetaiotaomicron]